MDKETAEKSMEYQERSNLLNLKWLLRIYYVNVIERPESDESLALKQAVELVMKNVKKQLR